MSKVITCWFIIGGFFGLVWVLGLIIARENTYEHAQTVISSFEKILKKSGKIGFFPNFWLILGNFRYQT